MKITQTLLLATTLSASLLAATGANATLISALGGQVVNDTDLNITWLANANMAATNSFGLAREVELGTIPGVITSGDNAFGGSYIFNDGRMTWGGALKWIAAMNTANYLGYNDWRLPITTDTGTPGCNYSFNGTDCGFNSTGSEMSHLFFVELGNKAHIETDGNVLSGGYGLVNKGPFTDFHPDYYASGTELANNPSYAWFFNPQEGFQYGYDKDYRLYALAVRPGQVATAPPVPVPAAAWLLGSGLLGLVGVARRKAV